MLTMSIGQLQDEVRHRISTVAAQTTAADDRRALLARIQGDMAQLRAKVRDLELLAEEQETCADKPDALPLVMQRVQSETPSVIHTLTTMDIKITLSHWQGGRERCRGGTGHTAQAAV